MLLVAIVDRTNKNNVKLKALIFENYRLLQTTNQSGYVYICTYSPPIYP